MARMPWSSRRTEHEYVDERLSAYLDGELAPQEREVVERHLAACPDCQWNLETLRQTVQWTRQLPTLPVPRVFTIPLPAQPQPAPRWRWSLPLLQGATALVALLLVFVVAGDLLLGGALPLPGAAVKEQPAADMQPMPAEEVALELAPTQPLEKPEAAEKSGQPPAAVPTPSVPETAVAKRTVLTPTAENAAMGAVGFEPPPEGEREMVAEAAAAPPPTVTEAVATPTPARPTVTATLYPSPAPTSVAFVPQPEAPPVGRETTEGSRQEPLPRGLSWIAIEIALAVSFVLLAGATITLMVRRHR